jgi:hypothetical protein
MVVKSNSVGEIKPPGAHTSPGEQLKSRGPAAIAIGGDESFAHWNFCP